jgi:hypothetical protein
MCQSFQAGWLFGSLRELLAERVFAQIYGTSELHSSKEGFTFHRPTAPVAPNGSVHPVLDEERPRVCGKVQLRGHGEHFDQCASDTGLHCIQSSTSLIDQHEGSGCFMCWPGSHREHARMTKDIWRGRSDWVPLTDEELDGLTERGMSPKKVPVNAGDVVLWRSDLVHCGVGPSTPTSKFRAVSYTCMLPASMTPTDVLDGKLHEYMTMQTGDHRPNVKSRHFAPAKKKKKTKNTNTNTKQIMKQKSKEAKKEQVRKEEKTDSGTTTASSEKNNQKCNVKDRIKCARGQYFKGGPPRLTIRQAELYGLKGYGNEDQVRVGVRIK